MVKLLQHGHLGEQQQQAVLNRNITSTQIQLLERGIKWYRVTKIDSPTLIVLK